MVQSVQLELHALGSEVVSTHAPAQTARGEGHAQLPPSQRAPVAQAWLHPPQFAGSTCVSTHTLLAQRVKGQVEAVTQCPPAQVPLHGTPHPPQLALSVLVSTHAPPQMVDPPAQPASLHPPL